MSTRYVWDQMTIGKTYTQQQLSGRSGITDTNYVLLGTSYTFDSTNGVYRLSGSHSFNVDAWNGHKEERDSATYGRYATDHTGTIIVMLPTVSSRYFWQIEGTTGSNGQKYVSAYAYETYQTNYGVIKQPLSSAESYQIISSSSSGNHVSYISSISSSTYPSNGTLGSYWYKYIGSDNIDPYSLSYTSGAFEGKILSFSISPRTPVYSGTVQYQYQYSTNNGSSWTNIGTKTTATSIGVTVPVGATQIKVRVLASDNLGFTSTTYVVGDNLIVQTESSGDNCIGIGGTARQIDKIYIGVGGTAREVTEGYIGVGGTARKFYG